MKLHLGSPAFSSFKLERLRSKVPSHIKLTNLEADNLYLIDQNTELTELEKKRLRELIQIKEDNFNAKRPVDHFIITPRIGTISPWSSKATDILHHCALTKIHRIERGTLFTPHSVKSLTKQALMQIAQTIYDPMTESIFLGLEELKNFFLQHTPSTFKMIDILTHGKKVLNETNQALGLALSKEEIDYLYFKFTEELRKNPTDVELMMFAQANSEHCRHKIFNASWTIDNEAEKHSLFTMIQHTYKMHPEGVLTAYHDNGAVLANQTADFFFADTHHHLYQNHLEPIHMVIKVETHNHPTAIAPFPGAATGAGGEIRDEAATGRGAKPKSGLCGFSVSNLKIPDYPRPWEIDYGKPKTLANALQIMIEGPVGAASFNNEFGRPNLCGYFRTFEQEIFGKIRGYHKPIMIAGGLGNIRAINLGKKAIPETAKIIVLGGPAMKIGIGGGAASSMGAGSSSEYLDFASVQRENPEMQRRAQEVINACWVLGEGNPILSIHDVGAGGLANAVPEIIHDAKMGGEFELRQIPNAELGMDPLAIWCNESQERFVIAIKEESLTLIKTFAERERCPLAVIGVAKADSKLIVRDTQFDNRPVDLPMNVLLGQTVKLSRHDQKNTVSSEHFDTKKINLKEAVYRILQLPTVASKSFLITIGDRSVGGLTARDQMVGPWQIPVSDVAVTALGFNSYYGEAMAMGERTPIAIFNQAASARMAVAEAMTNIAAAGIAAISDIKLSANWMAACGVPGEDAGLYAAVKAIALELCPALGIAIPVGKDSLSMRTEWHEDNKVKSVISPMSLIVSAFSPVQDIRKTLTPQLQCDQGETDLILIDLGHKSNRMGGSCLTQVYHAIDTSAPDLHSAEDLKNLFKALQELKEENLILAYHDRSDGGLFVTVAEMCFAGQCGVNILLNDLGGDPIKVLFTEEIGVVIQVQHKHTETVLQLLYRHALTECVHMLGTVNTSDEIKLYFHQEIIFSEKRVLLQKAWSETSYHIQRLRDNPACADEEHESLGASNPGLFTNITFDSEEDITAPYLNLQVKPKVAVLREQGSNGQIEMAAAFHQAGFNVYDVHLTDVIAGRRTLSEFNGMAVCGGFSYGDVLGAGQGWAKSILFHDELCKAFEAFFANTHNFVLGVCNGCQMLSQLKSIIPGAAFFPEFKKNRSEQFEARFSMVKINESPSLFFKDMQGSQLPSVISHGEGFAVFANSNDMKKAKEQQLIAMQLIDNFGRVTERYPANPNGSGEGVTALTNQDGRITIMMPHPERTFRSVQNSWHPTQWGEYSPWMRMFRNARVWMEL